ncbi:sigma-70 family RNA polymerase sigma factor [Nakamurella alba]|uniref:sigma-70 family RNA polymerase sigma factor n=1 Tax=Nakamurella alba TaxID=2665158 RepID=UPI0018AAFFBD|nr:sigma-70 family RNA polymerase sigma factor [Nakamurella alba]
MGPDADDLVDLARRLMPAAVALSGPGPDAQDLVHDVITALLPRWDRLQGSRIAYARRALANTHIDRIRRRRTATAFESAQPPDPPEQLDPDGGQRVDVERALAALGERDRAVVVLRYLLDWSIDDTARAMGIPAGSVRRISSESLARLRADLALLDGEGGS